ncbi:MAG: hypothetical protein OIF32_04365 [Campylobacterales bacterium]|nr:hypothetical protein [Campylobacterales bacterium]
MPEKSKNFINSIDSLLSSEQKQIPIDISLEESVKSFLSRYQDVVERHQIYAQQRNKVDYLLIKRFLLTAYNNLTEMDLSIGRGRVTDPYHKLKNVEKNYEALDRFIKKPIEEVFDIVFLSKQISFKKIEKDIVRSKKVSGMYEGRVKALGNDLEILKNELELLEKGTPEYEKKEALFKKLNSSYTDTIQDNNELKAKLAESTVIIKEYKETNLAKFKIGFDENLKTIKDDIIIVLNGLSYTFDQILWEEARESIAIRKFFANSKIEGSFSSKTYLKYFLKNIDEKTKNTEFQELQTLYKYLEKNSTRYIFIVGRNSDEIAATKFNVEQIDKDYIVKATTDSEKVNVQYTREPFHLLIIDDDLVDRNFLDVIEEFWKQFATAKRDVGILVRFEDPQYEDIIRAGKAGIKNFMFKNKDEKTFIRKIKEII